MLTLVLSLQSFWAVAASTCAHEQIDTDTHFGHHEKHHEPSQRDTSLEDGPGNLAQADHHHFLNITPVPHVPALLAVVADSGKVVIHAVEPYPAISITALERPPKTLAELGSARSG